MKQTIAKWLVSVARKLDPKSEFLLQEQYEPRQIGIGYHISKNDVRDYRKRNVGLTSHRKGLEALICDVKKEIGTNIFASIYKHGLIEYEIKKSFWTADVKGRLFVYVNKETEEKEAE